MSVSSPRCLLPPFAVAPLRRPVRGGRACLSPLWGMLLLACLATLLSCSAQDRPRAHRKKAGLCTVLDKAFQPLRTDFEAEGGKVRLVGVVTPSCGDCNASVQDIQTMLLSRIKSEDFEVFMIWTSIMPSDVQPRAEKAAEMWGDPRIFHYWDDSGRIARAFARQAGVDPGRSIYNVFYLYGRNDTWDPDAKMAQEPPNQNALLAGWMPTSPRFRMGEHQLVRLPGWDVNALTAQVEQLLAEPARPPGAK
jgi:hypothetical protein